MGAGASGEDMNGRDQIKRHTSADRIRFVERERMIASYDVDLADHLRTDGGKRSTTSNGRRRTRQSASSILAGALLHAKRNQSLDSDAVDEECSGQFS